MEEGMIGILEVYEGRGKKNRAIQAFDLIAGESRSGGAEKQSLRGGDLKKAGGGVEVARAFWLAGGLETPPSFVSSRPCLSGDACVAGAGLPLVLALRPIVKAFEESAAQMSMGGDDLMWCFCSGKEQSHIRMYQAERQKIWRADGGGCRMT